jgi:hypothetical protein
VCNDLVDSFFFSVAHFKIGFGFNLASAVDNQFMNETKFSGMNVVLCFDFLKIRGASSGGI